MMRSLALCVGVAALTGVTVTDAAPRKVWKPVKAAKHVRASQPVVQPSVGVQRTTSQTVLSVGRGQLVNLPSPISDVFVADNSVADVQVRSANQLYMFGRGKGETSVYATNAAGKIVYSTNVRVAQNINSIDEVMKASFPDSDISAYTVGQTVILAGTVLTPEDSTQAERIAKSLMNPGANVNDPTAVLDIAVINRLKMATPMQVSLRVRIAEVSRTFSKEMNANLVTQDVNGSGVAVGVTQGRSGFASIVPDTANYPLVDASQFYNLPAGTVKLPFDPVSGRFLRNTPSIATFTAPGTGKSSINAFGRLLGLDVAGALDLGETEGFVSTLASPTVTALSGQKASFTVGGEVPVPTFSQNGTSTSSNIEFKRYGITLDFLPVVQSDGRILLTVKPEVSELDFKNAVGGVPGFVTRRVDTMVELGSGQSMVIGGLMKADNNSTISKMPGAGDVPVLGALFRSNKFLRGETELMIVVTPYLVRGVSDNKIVLPTDGYKAPTELGRIFNGDMYRGESKGRPVPTMAPPTTVTTPQIGASTVPAAPANPTKPAGGIAPGFGN